MDLSVFDGSKVFITGATGLIGSALVRSLLLHESKNPVKVVALVRNKSKAQKLFSDLPQERLSYIVCDVCDLKAENIFADYIIHCANQTASKAFVTQPVEVILSAVEGTKKVLEFALKNPVKGFVYLSTMEVYGSPATSDKIYETSPTNIDTMQVRSSYPESKRLCECLCASYADEYGLPAKVVRLTQTFGEGVDYNDGRLFAELARCVIEKRDIVLNTKGETERNYLYIQDATDAIFTVLYYGESGEAYNAANEDTYCSVYDMACMVADKLGEGIKVKVCVAEDINKYGYAPCLKMNLSTRKLNSLGFKAETDLLSSFEKMINDMRKNR